MKVSLIFEGLSIYLFTSFFFLLFFNFFNFLGEDVRTAGGLKILFVEMVFGYLTLCLWVKEWLVFFFFLRMYQKYQK